MTFQLKKSLVLAALVLAFVQPFFAQTPKTMRRLPDTGQTQSFTNTPGEDADYTQNPPFFKLNGDGTATDTVTGLMWQQTDGGEMTVENAAIFCENLTLGGHNDWRLPTPQEAYSILNQGKTNPALDVSVFDAKGRLVKRLLARNHVPAGNFQLVWDGRDGNGGRLPNGVYYWRIHGENGGSTAGKLILQN